MNGFYQSIESERGTNGRLEELDHPLWEVLATCAASLAWSVIYKWDSVPRCLNRGSSGQSIMAAYTFAWNNLKACQNNKCIFGLFVAFGTFSRLSVNDLISTGPIRMPVTITRSDVFADMSVRTFLSQQRVSPTQHRQLWLGQNWWLFCHRPLEASFRNSRRYFCKTL